MESGANNQERILETSLVQNGGLLKHGDRTIGRKSCCPGDVRSGLLYTCKLERGLGMI